MGNKTRKLYGYLGAALVIALLSGCALPLKVQSSSSPLIDTSETRGTKGRFGAGVQLAKSPQVVLSHDLITSDPRGDRPEMDNEALWLHLLGTYSVSEVFDIEARLFPGLRGKFQILRTPHFSLAMSFGGSFYPASASRDDSTSTTTAGTTSYKYNAWGYDGSVQMGYRMNPNFLLYGGMLINYTAVSGDYKSDRRTVPETKFAVNLLEWGPSMGVLWTWKFLNSRFALSVLQLESQGSTNSYFVAGTEVVFRFDWRNDSNPSEPAKD